MNVFAMFFLVMCIDHAPVAALDHAYARLTEARKFLSQVQRMRDAGDAVEQQVDQARLVRDHWLAEWSRELHRFYGE